MANDLLSALRTYLTKVSSGEKSPQEVAAALNTWARESSDAIKARVEEELARSAKKMGFAKQSEVDQIKKDLAEIRQHLLGATKPAPKQGGKKTASKAKKAPAKKSAVKKVSKKNSRKS